MNNPYFSVVLPTYNRGQMLGVAIESMIAQVFTDWELIVVDDGSTDDTLNVVESYQDDRIKYLFQENRERSAARNNGISVATGMYICFLDSDDFYLPEHLMSFYNYLISCYNPVELLYSGIFLENCEILSLPEDEENPSSNRMEFVTRNIFGPPQVCIHRNILEKHKFNSSMTIGEDLDLWLRILNEFPFHVIDKRTVCIKIHPGRTVNIIYKNIYYESLKSFRISIKNSAIRKKISPLIRRSYICDCYLGMSKYYLYKRMKIKASVMIIISMLYRPTYQLKYKVNILYNIFFNFNEALKLLK